MLSYKLKHLFSRVVASLSAAGMFSLGNAAAQAEDVVTKEIAAYNYTTSTMTFTAKYSDVTLNCDTNGFANLLPGEVYYNASGNAAGCKFLCVSGFALDVTGTANTSALYWNVGEKVPVSDAETTVYAMHGCVPRPVEFEVHDNFVSGFVVEQNGDESHTMGVVYPIYGSNDVRFGTCAGGNFLNCTSTDSYQDFVDVSVGYFEDSALAGYAFAGLMDKNGNMVMGADFNPLVDNFDHLIEEKFGEVSNVSERDNYLRQYRVSVDNRPVLYAKWTPKTIGVNFNCGEGTPTGSVSTSSYVTYGGELRTPECKAPEGMTFKGWNSSEAGKGFVSDFVVSPK